MKIRGKEIVTARFRVSWPIASEVPVTAPIQSYPSLDATLHFKDDGKGQYELTMVEHELDWDSQNTDAIAEESRRRLAPLWEFIRYFSAHPVDPGPPRVSMIDPEVHHYREVRLGLRTAIMQNVPLPPDGFFGAAVPDPRLTDWLRLANDARQSANDAHALRMYYMVLEEHPRTMTDLVRYARHLVSHAKLTSPKALSYLQAQLGRRVTRYDPLDPAQRSFLRGARTRARADVEALLSGYVAGTP